MKISPITNNNASFGSKIQYNETMQKGFELARKASKQGTTKDVEFAKGFADSVRTILKDGSEKQITFVAPEQGAFAIENGKKLDILSSGTEQEGYRCAKSVKKFASELEQKKDHSIETLKSQLEGAMALVDALKEKYEYAIQQDLKELEEQVKKSASL